MAVLTASALPVQQSSADNLTVPVNVANFNRAETDSYFTRTVSQGAFGKILHNRDVTLVAKQNAPRSSRDTLYSAGVFDFEAAPVTVTLPDTGGRFMSMEVISEDHYAIDVVYAPGRFTFTQNKVGTRYVMLVIRTAVDADNPQNMRAAYALQDAVRVEQSSAGSFEVPNWDPKSIGEARDSLVVLASLGVGSAIMFGRKSEVDPVAHLIGTATAWGGNPPSAAVFKDVFPTQNDGATVHRLTVKDVPVDGFWSISVYNARGYFEKNELDRYVDQQSDGEAEYRRLHHRAVRRLRKNYVELPSHYAGLELYSAHVPSAWPYPEWKLAVSSGGTGAEYNARFLTPKESRYSLPGRKIARAV